MSKGTPRSLAEGVASMPSGGGGGAGKFEFGSDFTQPTKSQIEREERMEAGRARARAYVRQEMEKVREARQQGIGPEIDRQVEMLRELMMDPEARMALQEEQRSKNIAEADARAKHPEIVMHLDQERRERGLADAKVANADLEQYLRDLTTSAMAIKEVRDAFYKSRSKLRV